MFCRFCKTEFKKPVFSVDIEDGCAVFMLNCPNPRCGELLYDALVDVVYNTEQKAKDPIYLVKGTFSATILRDRMDEK